MICILFWIEVCLAMNFGFFGREYESDCNSYVGNKSIMVRVRVKMSYCVPCRLDERKDSL